MQELKQAGEASKPLNRRSLPKKKKRPINGFRTSDNSNESTRGILPPIPATAAKLETERPGLVKLPVRSLDILPFAKPSTLRSTQRTTTVAKLRRTPAGQLKAAHEKVSNDELTNLSHKGEFRYSSVLSSEVPYFGALFPTRRAILARDSKPYIHQPCGGRFRHPADVKAHHQVCAQCRDENDTEIPMDWDKHPSCKVGYKQLNYARVKDGYVILDKKSYDKVENAIANGHQDSSKGEMATDVAVTQNLADQQDNSHDESGADKDADEEVRKPNYDPTADQMTGSGPDAAALRAIALGLRRRN